MVKNNISMVMLSTLLAACAATAKGPRFSPGADIAEDQARVYFYKLETRGVCLNVYIDEEIAGCLKDNGYFSAAVNPGPRAVAIETDSLFPHRLFEYEINAKGGETYFYKIVVGKGQTPEGAVSSKGYNTGMETGYNAVLEVEEGQALQELDMLNLSI